MGFSNFKFHSLNCNKLLGKEICDDCSNNDKMLKFIHDISFIKPVKRVNIDSIDDCYLMIPSSNFSWIYNLTFLKEAFSLSLFHRESYNASKTYNSNFKLITNKAKSISLHFIEQDEYLINMLIKNAIIAIINNLKANFGLKFSFTPELGYKIDGNTIVKAKWMKYVANFIGNFIPICLMYPGWYSNDIRLFDKLITRLDPSLIGIYVGDNPNVPELLKNVQIMKKLNPDKPIFSVGATNPDLILKLFKAGSSHFVINNWSRIGTKLRIFDLETKTLTENYKLIVDSCDCNGCNLDLDNKLEEFNISKNKDVIQVSLHNAINYRSLINNLKEEVKIE